MQKKRLLPVIILLLVILLIPGVCAVAGTANSVDITLNNRLIVDNTQTFYSNGSILVPAKEFAASLGGSFVYSGNTLSGQINVGENELIFRLDNSIAKFNGQYVRSPSPMRIVGMRFMIPAEFILHKFGAEVYKNTAKNTLMAFTPVDGKLIYQVQQGDTFWIISQLFGTTVGSLKQLNSLTNDMINVGQKLVIKVFPQPANMIRARTPKSATLRSGAGFNYSVVNYLPAQCDINVAGKNGNWYRVTTSYGNGYLYYTVVDIIQDIIDSAPDSSYFKNVIPVDTSRNYVTYLKYTVIKGDTLWSVSDKFGLPTYETASVNNLSNDAVLYPGQILSIPVHNIPVREKVMAGYGEVLDWYSEAQYLFTTGKTGKLVDLETGKSFMVCRTMGANHADAETLTAGDTRNMKDIFGGYWNWNRRAFILEADGRRFAVSVSGMPHAGVDSLPFLDNVANRSDSWGYGPNYDRIKGNGMDGHFDLYFLNGFKHADNAIDPEHQYMVLRAGGLQ